MITHGKLGSIVYTPQAGVKRIPALIGEAIDTIGAGDAFFALAGPPGGQAATRSWRPSSAMPSAR